MLDEKTIIERFQSVSNSQDQIPTLSLYLLAPNKLKYHNKIVKLWLKVLEKSKPSHRLTLFNLANDVIQHARRKPAANVFLDDFKEVLKDATLLMKHDQIRPKVQRIFDIWLDRRVYPEEFLSDLKTALNGSDIRVTAPSKIVLEFKLESLIDRMKKLQKRSEACKLKGEMVNKAKLEQLCQSTGTGKGEDIIHRLKDKSSGEQIQKDIDGVERSLIELVHSMEREVDTRQTMVELLEKSAIFYATQEEEAKIVANAYKNFAARVDGVKQKLDEHLTKGRFAKSKSSPRLEASSPESDTDIGPPPKVDPDGFAGLQAIMDLVAAEKQASQEPSSLDKRLSHLMQDVNKSINSSLQSIPLPPVSSSSMTSLAPDDLAQAQLTFLQTQAASQHFPSLYRPPPPPLTIPPPLAHHSQQSLMPPQHSQMLDASHMQSSNNLLQVDHNHYQSHQSQYSHSYSSLPAPPNLNSYSRRPHSRTNNNNNSDSASNIQPIQSLVSTRKDSSGSVGGEESIVIPGITSMSAAEPNWPFPSQMSDNVAATDDIETVEMDIESDEESQIQGGGVPLAPPSGLMPFSQGPPGRTLKVIETQPLPDSVPGPISPISGPHFGTGMSSYHSNMSANQADSLYQSQPINTHYTNNQGSHYSRQPPPISPGLNQNPKGLSYNRNQYSPTGGSSAIGSHRPHSSFPLPASNHQKSGRAGHHGSGRGYRH